MNQNTREHTKLIVLKEFVFKLDETINAVTQLRSYAVA